MERDDHQRRVNEFREDLQNLDATRVIRKHITTGSSAVLTEAEYYDLRNEVADYFELHPSQVVLVGSCRTGFSLKPAKRFEAFGDASDVDLAVVSRERFDTYWDLVFEHWRTDRIWAKTRRYRRFLTELFKGWMWPRRLPPSKHFNQALEWVEFEDRLGRERFKGFRSVGARLYRSWERLEAYQSIHVIACKNALPKGI